MEPGRRAAIARPSATAREIDVDVVVAGSGIAGISAGIEAARSGATVLVLEKADTIGGNARWAGGFDLESFTFEGMRAENPEGDPALQRVLVDSYEDMIVWLEELGVALLLQETPRRFNYDPGQGEGGIRAFDALRAAFDDAGGAILFSTPLVSLRTAPDGSVTGADARGPDVPLRVNASSVVLATGSFGRNTELKLRYLGPTGDRTGHYGTRTHDGDGLLAGLAAGAALSTGVSVSTGGLVFPPPFTAPEGRHELGATGDIAPEPVPPGVQNLLIRPPAWGLHPVLLVNLRGERYVDESGRYTVIGWKTTQQPLGLGFCLFDATVYEEDAATLELAIEHGAVVYRAETIPDLVDRLSRWRDTPSLVEGVDPQRLAQTIREYNEVVGAGSADRLRPPRRAYAQPFAKAPFYAAPVVQGVVDMAGGLLIDDQARVLDRSGMPIGGLYAAGADAGRAYSVEHAGLSFGCIFGRVAGRNAAARARTAPKPVGAVVD